MISVFKNSSPDLFFFIFFIFYKLPHGNDLIYSNYTKLYGIWSKFSLVSVTQQLFPLLLSQQVVNCHFITIIMSFLRVLNSSLCNCMWCVSWWCRDGTEQFFKKLLLLQLFLLWYFHSSQVNVVDGFVRASTTYPGSRQIKGKIYLKTNI